VQNSSDVANSNNGASAASIANLQKFLDTYVCQANKNQTGYFFFEAFDEPWKVSQRWIVRSRTIYTHLTAQDKLYGGVEGHWGLFNSE
jgi:exo-beta-1,3-glucanase (GH17 family)